MKKRFIVMGLAGVCAAFFAVGVVARPVGSVSFILENGGVSALNALALSRPDAAAWGEDRLPDVLAPGETAEIGLQPSLGGCLYDMKAAFESGREARLFRVDVCRLDGAQIILAD